MRHVYIAFLGLLWLFPSMARTAELPELLQNFSKSPVKQASFIETRSVFFLDKPLTSKGRLIFTAPDKMQKIYTEPNEILQRIDGDNLTISTAKEPERSLSLLTHPQLALGINAIRWLLAGDLDKLQEQFKLQYQTDEHSWHLTLVPHSLAMLDYIAAIHISGNTMDILQIRLISANGDSITTDLYDHH